MPAAADEGRLPWDWIAKHSLGPPLRKPHCLVSSQPVQAYPKTISGPSRYRPGYHALVGDMQPKKFSLYKVPTIMDDLGLLWVRLLLRKPHCPVVLSHCYCLKEQGLGMLQNDIRDSTEVLHIAYHCRGGQMGKIILSCAHPQQLRNIQSKHLRVHLSFRDMPSRTVLLYL
jgi:hypothetical protein